MNRIKLLKEKLSQLNEVKSFRTLKRYNYKPKTFIELNKILKIKADNKDPNLNDIDVSLLDTIGGFNDHDFFRKNDFYVDEWDVSNVYEFGACFDSCSKFNCDLSNWDVSNGLMFYDFLSYAKSFNKQIDHFDLSNATDVRNFLSNAQSFNKPVDKFKFNRDVKTLGYFFDGCRVFNQDISIWDVSNVEVFSYMFYETENFLQDLSGWDVSKAKIWYSIFKYSKMEERPELMPEKFRKDYI